MNEVSLAVQALSACDRLEQGVKEGDRESIAAVKAMIARWCGADFREVKGAFAEAFRCLMQKCIEGTEHDLALAMLALRCLTELQVAKAFGNDDQDEQEAL